jgi:hypothetical protein
MTPSKAFCSLFVESQRKAAGGSVEAIPEQDFEQANAYKVVYRSVAVLLAPTHEFGERIEVIREWGNKKLSSDEALQFLQLAHPYFKWLFANPREVTGFHATYDFIHEAWKDAD